MSFQQINKFFPFQQLLKLLLAMAFGIQLIIIAYNHFGGFHPIHGPMHFFGSLIIGTALSLIGGFLITIPDLLIIRYLNRRFPWNKQLIARVGIQLGLSVLLAMLISIFLTVCSDWISAYKEGLSVVLITNALIFSVVNILMMVILEAWLFFKESSQAKRKAETLRNELLQVRFEVLKNQINPHFLFNSLNVLSGLIEKDVVKAQLFIDEFAQVYRYVLETIEKRVVSLNDELGFVRSYIFLQQIRYGEDLQLTINLPAHLLQMLMPPLSLQVILENAIKHNIVNPEQPLKINIYSDEDWLIVSNNIQPKLSSYISTRLGQDNLVKRYALIGERIPRFAIESNFYTARLPLMSGDYDESINY